MSYRAGRLAWSFGILCVVLLMPSLLLLTLNDFRTLMTLNRPEGGFEFWVLEAIVAVTFPQAGISNTYLLIVNLAVAATFTPVGVLVARRRPSNSIGWLFCIVGLLAGVLVFADQYTVYALLTEPGSMPAAVATGWLESWVWLPPTASIFTLLPLLFPDGRPPTQRWWIVGWLALIGMATMGVSIALLPGPMYEQLQSVENPLGIQGASAILELSFGAALTILWACVPASAVSLILRLRRSERQERQQIKWFVYAAAMAAIAVSAAAFVRGAASADVVATVLQFVTLPLLPCVVAVAILRYRLYDIDVVINRTLVYGALTVTLALVYFGGVTAIQAFWRTLTTQQEQPQLAIVVSTLVIAALFNPLRHRIQGFIDRRFYRSKYDAAKTLEAFSEKLRGDTDLEALRDDLVGV